MPPISIFRVKRKREGEAADSLLVSCKKTKSDKKADDFATPVFKFAATTDSMGSDIGAKVKKAIRDEKLKRDIQTNSIAGLTDKKGEFRRERMKRMNKDMIERSRFKLIKEKSSKTLETIDNNVEDEEINVTDCDDEIECKLFDIHYDEDDTITCNGDELVKKKDDYVYDIYYMNDRKFDMSYMNCIGNIDPIYHHEYNSIFVQEEVDDVYSSDENAEDNWRNDYPDEDPGYIDNADYDYEYGQDGTTYEDYGVDDLSEQMALNTIEGSARTGMSYEQFKEKVLKDLP